MNCDQVFDVLTRGPFPNGDSDDASVERHLAACHECRALAEALQPAVQLLHEALAADESPSLPGYRGIYCESSVASLPTALQAALAEEPVSHTWAVPAKKETGDSLRPDAWRWVAVLSLSLVFGALGASAVWNALSHGTPVASGPGVDKVTRFQPSEAGQQWLGTLGLRNVCFPVALAEAALERPPAHAESRQQSAQFACCLQCHSSVKADRPALTDQAALDRTCHVCHNY